MVMLEHQCKALTSLCNGATDWMRMQRKDTGMGKLIYCKVITQESPPAKYTVLGYIRWLAQTLQSIWFDKITITNKITIFHSEEMSSVE